MWQVVMSGWLFAASASLAAAQGAPKHPPMEISIVRGDGAACEPDCPEWISAQGEIMADTPQKLRRVLQSLKGRKPPVLLSSPGGHVDAGIAMGRMLREAGLKTTVATTSLPPPCAPRDNACVRERRGRPLRGDFAFRGSVCASACTYVLAGGAARVIHPASHVGVHQITHFLTTRQIHRTFRVERRRINGRLVEVRRVLVSERVLSQSTRKSATPPRASVDKIGRHLAAMGLAPEVHALAVETPPEAMRYLTPDERRRFNVATASTDLLASLGFDRDNPFFAMAGAQAGYTGYASAGVFEGAPLTLEYSVSAGKDRSADPVSIRLLRGQSAIDSAGIDLVLRLPDGNAATGAPTPGDAAGAFRLDLPKARLCALSSQAWLVLSIERKPKTAAGSPLTLTRRAAEMMPFGAMQAVACPQRRWES
ncbi:MAG: hypothetical protein ACRCTI_19990 [Beijerinckiaceae bacterium]